MQFAPGVWLTRCEAWFHANGSLVECNQDAVGHRTQTAAVSARAPMIREAVITTVNTTGGPHVTPLGYRMAEERVVLAPFVPSQTLDNLKARPRAVLNFTTDVRIVAGCLTGRRVWPTVPAAMVEIPRLAGSLAHWELEVVQRIDDPVRPQFTCRIVHAATHGPFTGFNRAQAAVIEAAILVSRLDWLAPEGVREAIAYLQTAVTKTAGPLELEAWEWLLAAIRAHPRHGVATASAQ